MSNYPKWFVKERQDEIDRLKAENKELKEALEQIESNPCLDPEGNADIARQALSKYKGE